MVLQRYLIGIIGLIFFISCAQPKGQKSQRAKDRKSSAVELGAEADGVKEVKEGEDATTNGAMLALAQSLHDKQPAPGDGVCADGNCIQDVNLCASLNVAKNIYDLSADGTKCVLNAAQSCEKWEKKDTEVWPIWNETDKKWQPFEVEVCKTDEIKCQDTTFNRNSTWYELKTVKRTFKRYVDDKGELLTPVPTSNDYSQLATTEKEEDWKICVQKDAYCADNFGDLSTSTPEEDVLVVATGRSKNACSVSPKFCRANDNYLNATNADKMDENTIVTPDMLEWESECVALEGFKTQGPAVCKAHGMEYDVANDECYSDTKDSCENSGKVWVTDDMYPRFIEIMKNYQYLYSKYKQNSQKPNLNYDGFVQVDYTLPNYEALGIPLEDAKFQGMFPVKPNKRCQYANIETCRLLHKLYDPYQRSCVDSMQRNLMLVLRKLEIDNSVACIDHWTEHEGPNASEMAQNVAGSILTLGIMPAMGGWNDGKDVRKEAPFTYEFGDFRFLTSSGESGELLSKDKTIKNIAIPHKKQYAFLQSNIFPVEIKGSNFCFDVKFDVHVKGKALVDEKRLFGSILRTFCYTDTHYPYEYRSLWKYKAKDKNNNETFNTEGFGYLYDELRNEFSYDHITSAFRRTDGTEITELDDWFVSGVNESVFQGAENEHALKKQTDSDGNVTWVDPNLHPSTRLSYKLIRNNWDDRLHKESEMVSFNPKQVYTQETQRGGSGAGKGAIIGGSIGAIGGPIGAVVGAGVGAAIGDATTGSGDESLKALDPTICYGRVVWSWQWFKG